MAFIAGSFAAVLLVASLIDPDLFLHFEITPHRTVLFYLGIFGSVLAMARGMVPEENLVFDPDASLREVVRWTHYLPGEWRGKLHSQMVSGRATVHTPQWPLDVAGNGMRCDLMTDGNCA